MILFLYLDPRLDFQRCPSPVFVAGCQQGNSISTETLRFDKQTYTRSLKLRKIEMLRTSAISLFESGQAVRAAGPAPSPSAALQVTGTVRRFQSSKVNFHSVSHFIPGWETFIGRLRPSRGRGAKPRSGGAGPAPPPGGGWSAPATRADPPGGLGPSLNSRANRDEGENRIAPQLQVQA
jgi:hypothetical protein